MVQKEQAMNNREKILSAIATNQPALKELPVVPIPGALRFPDPAVQFASVIKGIGGTVVEITELKQITDYLYYTFKNEKNFVTTVAGLDQVTMLDEKLDPHFLENIEVAVLHAKFGVAENGSVWLTEEEMRIRALPFICQHLAVLVQKDDFVHNMHEAYVRIGNRNYGFGVFIAGPSKTADIEQSLVLGAHGPKTMTVFIKS